MSNPIRVAIACEGPTDLIVLKAAIDAMLPKTDKLYTYLQPETTPDLKPIETNRGYGWSGIYRWCKQAVAEGGGRISGAFLFDNIDLLIVQMDADVAEKTYEGGKIADAVNDLPCVKPCPPASNTTNALRAVLLRWFGESTTPPKTVLCTPSKNIEAWVVVALFPDAALLKKEKRWGSMGMPPEPRAATRRAAQEAANWQICRRISVAVFAPCSRLASSLRGAFGSQTVRRGPQAVLFGNDQGQAITVRIYNSP